MSVAPCPGCENERTQVFDVEGLDCADEVALIERRLRALEGVCSVRASALSGQATVVHTLEDTAIERALAEVGLRAREARLAQPPRGMAVTTAVALALTLAGYALSLAGSPLAVALYLPAILVGGAPIARRGWLRARQRVLDMNALMTVAVLGAMGIGEWAEGATTVVLFALANVLEARSLERARRAIGELVSRTPDEARVRRDGTEVRVAAERVAPGETVLVAPGERFPLDGVVSAGISEADQAPITGESLPVPKQPGDEVFAGAVNGRGLLEMRVTRPVSETTLARIIRRVEQAQASRAPSQGFVERFARVYTPAVVALAFAVALVPPLALGGALSEWVYRALVLLVISCPCALVISTPVAIVSALTAASRRGVLVKGGAHLEALAAVRGVVFDKTGTLTRGEPEVTDAVAAPGRSEEELLRLAAGVEGRSGHPLGAALARHAAARGLTPAEAQELEVLPGRGVRGRIGARVVLVGSHRLFDEQGLCDHRLDPELERWEGQGKTAVLVAAAGDDGGEPALLGAVALADAPRAEASEAVAELRRAGLHVVMLTGDNRLTAESIARRLGVAEHRAELLPEEKAERLVELQRARGSVAMVGDGVNDAPALAASRVGIAMSARGSDAALETADIALVADDLRRVPESIRLGRAARRVIVENITVALTVKGLVLALALAGYGSLWAAVAADMGASLLVIGNSLRLLHRGEERAARPVPVREAAAG